MRTPEANLPREVTVRLGLWVTRDRCVRWGLTWPASSLLARGARASRVETAGQPVIMPAPTVAPVASSIRMNEPVEWFLRYGSVMSGTVVRR